MKKSVVKRCNRCTLPSNFRNIKFDRNGICNFCHEHDKYIEKFRRFSLAKKLFLEQINSNKGRYRYDCAVGISGGKDSTYVLYKLVTDYNLKVLAITFDNNFLNDIALANIKKIVDMLGVDHVFLSYDKDIHYRLYKEAAIHFGWPCLVCSFFAIALELKYCFDNRIPIFVHGFARSQMLREISKYSLDAYLPYYGLNYRPYVFAEHFAAFKSGKKRFDSILKILIPDADERQEFIKRYIIDPPVISKERFLPQFVSFFLMHDYDEKEIIEFLAQKKLLADDAILKEYHHYDCLAHDAFKYIYKQAFGWSLLELEIAFDVRDGKIDRQLALQIIEDERIVRELPLRSFEIVCSRLNTTVEDLMKGLAIARRNIRVYTRLMKIKNFFRSSPFIYI